MNWLELTHTHPKVMADFRSWAYEKNMGYNPHKRVLYDFFDEQGIHIRIRIVDPEPQYGWYFRGFDNNFVEDESLCPTRTEAEEQAFLRAFEILEDKLKEGR